jgi:hypothetical protein
MIETLPSDTPGVLEFRLSGKLHDEDYKVFVPAVDAAVKASGGKVRMLARFEDFHGWDLPALWDDVKFAAGHYSSIEKIALVGENAWEKWMAKVCSPFTGATIRYFNSAQVEDARAWVCELG